MKKPIFTEKQRRTIPDNVIFQIAILKIKREFENSAFGRFTKKIVIWLAEKMK